MANYLLIGIRSKAEKIIKIKELVFYYNVRRPIVSCDRASFFIEILHVFIVYDMVRSLWGQFDSMFRNLNLGLSNFQ